MFAIVRLLFLAQLLQIRIVLFGMRVRVRETAYHMLTRYSYRTGVLAFAVDLDDADVKAAIKAAVDEAIGGLQTKNKELLAKVAKLSKGSEIDPAEVERLEAELDALKGQFNEQAKALKTATKAADDATKALGAEQAFTQRTLIDSGLIAELTANGVTSPHLLKAAAAMIRDELKPAVVIEGDARSAKIGDKSLADAVKEWAGTDAGKTFVSAPGNNGGGAMGGAGKGGAVNPWAKGSENLTAQSQLYQSNPSQARALAAEAGVTIP